MNGIKICIPKMSGTYKIYVYCSQNYDDINTIDKIKTLKPSFIIDESNAKTEFYNNKECYILEHKVNILYDNIETNPKLGVTYLPPSPSLVPMTEYETSISILQYKDYTFYNILELKPLDISYKGTMLYYSAIGVDEANGTITHLSKVSGILVQSSFKEDGTREIYSSSNGKDFDFVGKVDWQHNIIIGDITDTDTYSIFKSPFIETVPAIRQEDISANIKMTYQRNFMVLRFPNPWCKNNKEYNYRKLKSFKIRNVNGFDYGQFSIPTYQSTLPVSIEKMIVLCQQDKDDIDAPIPLKDKDKANIYTFEIIRRNGLYYNGIKHKYLGVNKYTIDLKEDTAVFNEYSQQDYINKEVKATVGHTYTFTFYLEDMYKNISTATTFNIRT